MKKRCFDPKKNRHKGMPASPWRRVLAVAPTKPEIAIEIVPYHPLTPCSFFYMEIVL